MYVSEVQASEWDRLSNRRLTGHTGSTGVSRVQKCVCMGVSAWHVGNLAGLIESKFDYLVHDIVHENTTSPPSSHCPYDLPLLVGPEGLTMRL
jgi:hypothetical protein